MAKKRSSPEHDALYRSLVKESDSSLSVLAVHESSLLVKDSEDNRGAVDIAVMLMNEVKARLDEHVIQN